MSLLINGMGMPRNKGLFYDLLLSLSFDGFGEIFFNGKSYPIAEISTPHGRLIDADEFFNKAKEYLSNSQNDFYRVSLLQIFKDILNSTETVIEKENAQ